MRGRHLRVVAAVLIVASFTALPARARDLIPPNDDFSNATVVDELPYRSVRDLALATREASDPLCSLSGVGSVWYRIAAATDRDLRVWADSYQVAIGIYEGETLETLQPVRNGCYTNDTQFTARAGSTYFVLVIWEPSTYGIPDDRATITVEETGGIEGVVLDDAGNPAAGACVSVGRYEYAQGGYADTVTAEDGTYRLSMLPAGDYRIDLGCWNGRYVPDDTFTTVRHGRSTAVPTARLDRRSVISGTIRDADGEPNPWGGCVSAYDATSGNFVDLAHAGQGGHYVLPLAPGSYKVHFSCGDFSSFWYDGASTFDEADVVPVVDKQETGGIDAFASAWVSPPGDTRATAIPIAATPFSVRGRFSDARWDESDRESCAAFEPAMLWFTYTAPDAAPLVVSVDDRAPVYSLYEQGPLGLRLVSCTNGRDGLRSLAFVPEPGRTYWIQVGVSLPQDATVTADTSTAAEARTFSAAVPCYPFGCPYDPSQACVPDPASPPGSWDDVPVTVPDLVEGRVPTYLVADVAPAVDRDLFFCRAAGDDRFVAMRANSLYDDCELQVIACRETAAIAVQPGEHYVIRVYNWGDAPPAEGSVSFVVQR